MSQIAVARPSAASGLLARRPLTWFFLIAFGMSWLVWAPLELANNRAGLLPYEVSAETAGLITLFGVIVGPTLAALVMTAATEGRPGLARLLRRCVASGDPDDLLENADRLRKLGCSPQSVSSFRGT